MLTDKCERDVAAWARLDAIEVYERRGWAASAAIMRSLTPEEPPIGHQRRCLEAYRAGEPLPVIPANPWADVGVDS